MLVKQTPSVRTVPTTPVKPAKWSQRTQNSPYRESELLVRFRPGVLQRDKDMIIATQSARRKKQLEGESGVEKLELHAGHELVQVASDSVRGFGHPQMAQAAYAAAVAQGYKNVSKPPAPGSKDYDYQSANYFESRFFDACR